MKIINKLKNFIVRHNMSKTEQQRLETQRQLDEYNARQSRYNDLLRDELQKQKFLNKMQNIKKSTFTKKMVMTILAIAIFDIQLSYILAFFDKGQVVDSLSNQLCITILGVSFIYMVRAYFDSKAEHKNLDEAYKTKLEENIGEKITELFDNAGIDIDIKDLINSASKSLDNDNIKSSTTSFNFNITKTDNSASEDN